MGNRRASKRWTLLRPAYVLLRMTQKKGTTVGEDKEGVNEEPSPLEGKKQWDPEWKWREYYLW